MPRAAREVERDERVVHAAPPTRYPSPVIRTLRELAGWALLLIVQLSPVASLFVLAGWIDEEVPDQVAYAALLGMLAWPRLLLTSRRLREPSPHEVAEADERAPVLLLHRFAYVAEPWWARMLVIFPAFWREARDARVEGRLKRALSKVGPVVPLVRPAPEPEHGPVRPVRDPEWERELLRRLRRASLVTIAVDGSEENRFEIERSVAMRGLARIILVLPAGRKKRAFTARYEAMRKELAFLPELHPRVQIVRFDAHGHASQHANLTFEADEVVPAPKAPAVTWFLTALPVVAGLLSAIATPSMLRAQGFHRLGDGVGWGVAVFSLGIVLAVLSRRAVRLVAPNEAVMVSVAAGPWIFAEAVLSLEDTRLLHWLGIGATAAAYSAPLLVATAFVLAGASLVRKASNRRAAYAAFGLAALLPFVPFALSLGDAGIGVMPLLFVFVFGSAALGLCAWAASGEPARAHAPLPIGGAVAAVFAIAAWSVALTHVQWVRSLGAIDEGSLGAIVVAQENVAELGVFVQAWPFLVMLAPAVVVLIALQFARRASRAAIANLAAFAPMIFVCAYASGTAVVARANVMRRSDAHTMLSAASGGGLDREFELAWAPRNYEPPCEADIVLERGGAFMQGRRVAAREELRGHGNGWAELSRELRAVGARARSTPLCVAADGRLSFLDEVVGTLGRAGWQSFALLVRTERGIASVPMSIAPPPRPSSNERIRLFLQIREAGYALAATDGTYIDIPRVNGVPDQETLLERMRDRRTQDPNRSDILVAPESGQSVSTVVEIWTLAVDYFPAAQLVDGASL